MGLAISRSIIEAHHGALGVEPRATRSGATVCLTLPLAATGRRRRASA